MNVSREFACWKRGIVDRWPELQIVRVDATVSETMYIGDSFEITALIRPGSLRMDEFDVQLYSGEAATDRALNAGDVVRMAFRDQDTDGNLRFCANLELNGSSGRRGYTVRVLPSHADLVTPFLPHLITWASSGG